MNGSTPHVPDSWLARLGGSDASGWLRAFRQNAFAAVDDLLWNRFYFGPLNLTERGQLLAGWLDVLGNDEGFAQELDTRLTEWVDRNWGRFDQPGVVLASAWTCLTRVVEVSARLHEPGRLINTAETLRARFPERERFLGSFSTAPATDPSGFYLAAIAEFQGQDRSLAAFWHRLCDLPDGVPYYHARHALLGLRRLKAAEPEENGSLRAEVVLGLLRVAQAFDRLVRARGLGENVAKGTFRRLAVQLAAAYPDSPGWSKHGLAMVLRLPARPQRWVLESIRPLATAVRKEQAQANRPHTRPRRSIEPNPRWPEMRAAALIHLRSGRLDRIAEVEQLLDEQRQYADATGDTYFVVRSLCNFASRILEFHPSIAERWAEEARGWEPRNPFTWTTIKDVLLNQSNIERALLFSWVAWKRFPEDVVPRNGLAEVLKVAGRHAEAEEIYRQTIERFPGNVVARNGLAEVLKAAGRHAEAEEIYRQTIECFSENVVARSGLAEVLKAAGRHAEAEDVYRQTIDCFPENVIARNGLAQLLKTARRHAEAEEAYRQTIERFPENVVARSGLAEVLKAAGRHPEAEEVYRKTIKRFPENVVARNGLADVLKAAGRYSEAEEVYRQIIERFPDDVVARNGLADVLRRAHRWADAEVAYREAIAAGHMSCYTYVGLAYLVLRHGEAGRVEALSLVDQALRLDRRNSYALALKQKIEPRHGADVSAIADEWDQIAAALLSSQESSEAAEEIEEDESPAALDFGTEQRLLLRGTKLELPEQQLASLTPRANQVVRREAPVDSIEFIALLAEASFYRVWAARNPSDNTVSLLRPKASALLARAEALSPNDAQLVAERVALQRSQGGNEAAAGQLTAELGKHPASAPLLILKARLDREIARQERRLLSEEALEGLLQAPQRIRDLNHVLLPVFHLEKGLAALALRDGAVRVEKAAEAFSSFRRIVSRRAAEEQTDRQASLDARAKSVPRFHEWLQSTTTNLLFRDFAEPEAVQASEVPVLEQSLAENPLLFEEVEDVIVDRWAFAIV